MATVLDYSVGRPAGQAVANDGHAGVVRYIGTPGREKNLTAAEFADMNAHGRGVAVVYENKAGDSAGGFSAGQAAARAARADANGCGLPPGQLIYFAVDSDQVTPGQFAAAMSYLDGAVSVLGWADVGVYGEFDIVEMAVGPHVRLGWQTVAWSHGKHSAKAALYQRAGQVFVGGVECDVSDVLAADWGQHNYTGAPAGGGTTPTTSSTTGVELMERKTIAASPNTTAVRLLLSGSPGAAVVVRPGPTPVWIGNVFAWGNDKTGIGHNPKVEGRDPKVTSARRYELPGALWCDLEYSAQDPFDLDIVG